MNRRTASEIYNTEIMQPTVLSPMPIGYEVVDYRRPNKHEYGISGHLYKLKLIEFRNLSTWKSAIPTVVRSAALPKASTGASVANVLLIQN